MDPTTEILMRGVGAVHKESIPYWVALLTEGATTTTITDFAVSSGGDVFVIGKGAKSFVARIDDSGSVVWCNYLDTFFPVGIVVDASDNVYAAGAFVGWTHPTSIIKYDSSGVQQWAKSYTPENHPHGSNQRALAIDASGFLYMSGYTGWSAGITPFKYVAKIEPNGAVSWAKHTTTADKPDKTNISAPQALAVGGTANDVFLLSAGADAGPINTIILTKFDKYGALVWQKKWAPPAGASNGALAVVDDSVYVGFSTTDTSDTSGAGGSDIMITRLDSGGVYKWQKSIGSPGEDWGMRLRANAAGDLFVLGEMNTREKLLVAKFNSSATIQWQRALDKGSQGRLGAIGLFPNGDLCVGGWGTAPEAIVARLPADGSKAGTYNGVHYAASTYLAKTRHLVPADDPTTVQAFTMNVADLPNTSTPDALTSIVTRIP